MRPRQSIVSVLSVVAFVAVLTFSAPVYAADATVPLNDPIFDTIQLWSNVLASIESMARDLATGLFPLTRKPTCPGRTRQATSLSHGGSSCIAGRARSGIRNIQ